MSGDHSRHAPGQYHYLSRFPRHPDFSVYRRQALEPGPSNDHLINVRRSRSEICAFFVMSRRSGEFLTNFLAFLRNAIPPKIRAASVPSADDLPSRKDSSISPTNRLNGKIYMDTKEARSNMDAAGTLAKDLTKAYPRSPRETRSGYVIAARTRTSAEQLLPGPSVNITLIVR
jgi:hypothetical protein